MIDIPPVWLVGFLIAAWVVGQAAPIDAGWLIEWIGRALVLLGFVITVLAILEFRRARTTVIPRETPSAIVTSGIFGLSRNPIYLADAVILTGFSLWWQAALALPLVPVFMWLIQTGFIRQEEAGLFAEFPSEANTYFSNVRRWI